jgi:flagellar hook-basal body complex protein FliE
MARGDSDTSTPTAATSNKSQASQQSHRAASLETALKNVIAELDQLQPMASPKEEQIARFHKVADEARAALSNK